jgi:hypothetical protein
VKPCFAIKAHIHFKDEKKDKHRSFTELPVGFYRVISALRIYTNWAQGADMKAAPHAKVAHVEDG